ncbi:DUF4349 domain-containing protein [Actinomadura gamaensis]|uniref:DUF4349 domain-containing protein n=1 Tax=Actinomadura gamaensis TaxID=1763541 RepID=A0ABV9U7N8_9ACTN
MRSLARTTKTPRLVICAILLFLLAACSGAGGSNASRGRAAGAPQAGAPQAGSPGRAQGNGAAAAPKQAAQARAVVFTADLRVRTPDVNAAASRAKQLAASVGGYVDSENGTSEPVPSETLVLKIPSAKFAPTLDQLASQLGTRLSLRQQAQDQTGEVADVASRVRSAQATLASFRKLLDRAGSMDDVMNVEQEISRRESDLEALQSRQKSLDESTSYGTVTVGLETPPVARVAKAKAKSGPHGFVGGLKTGWHGLVAVVSVLLTILGWALPFVGALALVGVPALMISRRVLGRRTRPGGGSGPVAASAAPGRPGPE